MLTIFTSIVQIEAFRAVIEVVDAGGMVSRPRHLPAPLADLALLCETKLRERGNPVNLHTGVYTHMDKIF